MVRYTSSLESESRQNIHQSDDRQRRNGIEPEPSGRACARLKPVDVGAVGEAAVAVAVPLQVRAAVVRAIVTEARLPNMRQI